MNSIEDKQIREMTKELVELILEGSAENRIDDLKEDLKLCFPEVKRLKNAVLQRNR